jgi:hypothetical protein
MGDLSPPPSSSRPLIASLGPWLIAVAAYCVAAWPDFFHLSGDALIHFVYASRAAQGRWFEFSPGELSAGSTSIFYTAALTLLIRWFGVVAALYAACAGCIAAIALALWYVQRGLRQLGASPPWVIGAGLAMALNPGLSYNSPVGIEAPFFALAVTALIARDPDSTWATARAWDRRVLGTAVIGALVMVLRPEGAMVLGLTLAALALSRRPNGDRVGVTAPMVVVALGAGAALLATLLWQWRWTGVFFPASAYSRLMMARREGLHLGPLWIYPRFPQRLVAYAPLTVAAFAAPWLVRLQRGAAGRLILTQIAAILTGATVIYTFVTGAAHVARYMMFLVPPLVIAAALVAQWGWQTRRGRCLVAAAVLGLATVYGAEAILRARWRVQAPNSEIKEVIANYKQRAQRTDELMARTRFDLGRCKSVRVTYGEVQIALWFDDRVQVVSTDGRVWPVGTSGLFREDGSVDGARWVSTLHPTILVDVPDTALNDDLKACADAKRATCDFGGVVWVKRPGLGAAPVWVDSACTGPPGASG